MLFRSVSQSRYSDYFCIECLEDRAKKIRSFVFNAYSDKFFDHLYLDFESFLSCFDSYLHVIVEVFQPLGFFQSPLVSGFDKVYSFNYTKTILRFYDFDKNFDFLHGETGNAEKKIVMGVSDLGVDLRVIKLYRFTKYHQKMMNNTDFKFLKEGNDVCKRPRGVAV